MTDEADREHADYLQTFDELKGLNTEGLKQVYDKAAKNHSYPRASFFLDEIRRRESARRERIMMVLTGVIIALTVFIAILTYAVWHDGPDDQIGFGHRHANMRDGR